MPLSLARDIPEITSPPFTRPEPAGTEANSEERILFHLLPRIPRDPTLTRSCRRFGCVVNRALPLSEAEAGKIAS